MKTTYAIITLVLICIGIEVMAGGESISYVKTGGKVYFGQDLKIGLFNTRIITPEGTVQKVKTRDIKAYMHDSRLFEYLPVVCDNKDTLCFAMMEYVTSRSGLKLYRYTCYDEREARYGYFVFKNGRFYLGIDQKNAEATLPFFGIKVL